MTSFDRRGNTPFLEKLEALKSAPSAPQPEDEVDFSGLSLSQCTLEARDLTGAILNGCEFDEVRFMNMDFKHVELCEVQMTNCEFMDCKLDHADFVGTRIRRCKFTGCSFTNGEWRGTDVRDTAFLHCAFPATTIGLCSFVACVFDQATSATIPANGKRFNTFSECEIDLSPEHRWFLRRNFGLRSHSVTPDIVNAQPIEDRLHGLAIAAYQRNMTTHGAVDAILATITRLAPSTTAYEFTQLCYAAAVLKALIEEDTFSPSCILFVSDSLLQLAERARSQPLLLELLGLTLHLRSHLLNRCREIRESVVALTMGGAGKLSCSFYFPVLGSPRSHAANMSFLMARSETKHIAAAPAPSNPSAPHMDRRGDNENGTDAVVSELAKVFYDRDRATRIAIAAGFPTERIPDFRSPTIFWQDVEEEARNGVLPGGILPIVTKAADYYPNNPVFAHYQELKRTAPRVSSVPPQDDTARLVTRFIDYILGLSDGTIGGYDRLSITRGSVRLEFEITTPVALDAFVKSVNLLLARPRITLSRTGGSQKVWAPAAGRRGLISEDRTLVPLTTSQLMGISTEDPDIEKMRRLLSSESETVLAIGGWSDVSIRVEQC